MNDGRYDDLPASIRETLSSPKPPTAEWRWALVWLGFTGLVAALAILLATVVRPQRFGFQPVLSGPGDSLPWTPAMYLLGALFIAGEILLITATMAMPMKSGDDRAVGRRHPVLRPVQAVAMLLFTVTMLVTIYSEHEQRTKARQQPQQPEVSVTYLRMHQSAAAGLAVLYGGVALYGVWWMANRPAD